MSARKIGNHGMSRTPEYRVWASMIDRCTATSRGHARYFDRGIRVCAAWRRAVTGFTSFFAHVGPRPSEKHTLDRIENDKGYKPGNVRWATWREQANNRDGNRLISVHGRTQTVAEWAREKGITRDTIADRLRLGWSNAHAVTVPRLSAKDRACMRGVGPCQCPCGFAKPRRKK